MQGFQIAAARYLNRVVRRRGPVFPDRYRARILTTRLAVRRALRELPTRERSCAPLTWLLRVDGTARGARSASLLWLRIKNRGRERGREREREG